MPSQVQITEWHKAFSRIERVDDHQKLKKLHKSICSQIETLTEDIQHFKAPRNPREDAIQVHDKMKLDMLKKQKTRLEPKITELEQQIAADMEAAKNELR